MLTYLGMGSNLDQPLQQVTQAVEALRQVAGIHLLRRSPWYRSKAIGPGEQPDYVNGVLEMETSLTATDLLKALQQIEQQQGRTRDIHWGPRRLDLDILLYGDHCIDNPTLKIPHPRLKERTFVLQPLATLNPQLRPPAPRGEKSATIAALLAQLPSPEQPLAAVQLLEGEHEVVAL